MGIFGALTTAVTGLRAQSFALENISGNIANSRDLATDSALDHDVSKLLLIQESSLGIDRQLKWNALRHGRLADYPGSHLLELATPGLWQIY